MPEVVRRFWGWYEKNYVLNAGVALVLFTWQLVHLYWLGAHVIAMRLTGISYFPISNFWQTLLILVAYMEVPAIISTTLLYFFELQKHFRWRIVGLLILLNSQWLHLFWITDEFVVGTFLGAEEAVLLPVWLAWVAILIDYVEIPVIIDVFWRFVKSLRQGQGLRFIREELH